MFKLRLFSPLMVALALTGCEGLGVYNSAEHALSVTQANPIEVQKSTMQAQVSTSTNQKTGAITVHGNEDLQEIVDAYQRAGGGTVKLTVYGQHKKQLKAALQYLGMAGINEDTILITHEPSTGNPHIEVSFNSYLANPPACTEMWTKNSSDAYRNTNRKGYGCATQHNLAVMLVNPGDLQEMRPLGYASGSKRMAVYNSFNSGSGSGLSTTLGTGTTSASSTASSAGSTGLGGM